MPLRRHHPAQPQVTERTYTAAEIAVIPAVAAARIHSSGCVSWPLARPYSANSAEGEHLQASLFQPSVRTIDRIVHVDGCKRFPLPNAHVLRLKVFTFPSRQNFFHSYLTERTYAAACAQLTVLPCFFLLAWLSLPLVTGSAPSAQALHGCLPYPPTTYIHTLHGTFVPPIIASVRTRWGGQSRLQPKVPIIPA